MHCLSLPAMDQEELEVIAYFMLMKHKRLYVGDMTLSDDESLSADYAEELLRNIFPDTRKLKQENLGDTLTKAYGIIYSHAMDKISTKTAAEKLVELSNV